MTPNDLKEVASLQNWSKHIILWKGREQKLKALLEGRPQKVFDILDLCDEDESLPSDDDERRDLLEQRLESALQRLRPVGVERVILLVKNAAILARWKVSLQPFFDYFGGSRTMVILCLDGSMPAGKWPIHLEQQLEYDPQGTTRYLTSCLADASLVYSE